MEKFRGMYVSNDSATNSGIVAGFETKYLASKHFDLFNLIPEGMAIDKTRISNGNK
jgi:hypothetical protein